MCPRRPTPGEPRGHHARGAGRSDQGEAIHAALAAKGLLPAEHLADGAYLSAAHLARSGAAYGVTLFGPTKPGSASKRREGGLTPDAFRVD